VEGRLPRPSVIKEPKNLLSACASAEFHSIVVDMSAESAVVLARRKLLSGSQIVVKVDHWIQPHASLARTSKLSISVLAAVAVN
jgi:hypothetical protein